MSAVIDLPAAPARRIGSRKLIAGGVIGLALVGYGVHWWTTGRFIQDTDDAYVGGDTTVVGSKVSGYIEKILVTDNQVVRRGDLLVQIDDRDYKAAVARAEASVAAQEAALHNLDATAELQRSVIAEAQAGVAAARAEATRAKLDDARYSELSGRSAVSIESAQRARATFQTARAATDKASAAAAAAKSQLDVIDTQRGQVRAALASATAELDLARLNLSYTQLRAPMDGTIGNRRARVGTYANAASPMLVVVPAHGLWVDANFKEDQLSRMKVGQAVDVRADVMPDRHFRGHIASLAPATGSQFSVLPPENATGNFTKIVQRVPVRVVLDGADGDLGVLRPGLSVTATVDTKQ
ncbi:membrane fusion protein, multidrug efflux system [Luteibacter sp. UNCMF331Sha3.1]|uniref:HlyD family secretion protein n=1 Tax=Luteibacter sp. UNCMF331Sha3.1 TaxID=1502760 RepID=UPI0008ABE94E|nr:HlyD family secretion protein [Luteibacter sp. UNCMF331Sha3.1]SEN11654.1 membrane fusion protein, multidrug efflux system [Luteibacter sp. UNCMF331Sha3.1]